ncbi:hypothetical protein BAUCODRAFT_430784 [Baudoinia panamericana UAMH 10762]|uniref:Utp14-domain-containing protein n=1 Tax=Baudoinia panamericana (strain UAMH 10762) TaxID=717646 RepID=M2MPB5_BAUPA|nr:uncharacterized protein BAUCODRAFT_430784 [Baudoinia panamericana UAMH 10762]EMC98561.1 hypothetical protein BAUCODRAFT_430784 [Baudoinia panamericana UAMH 10762]
MAPRLARSSVQGAAPRNAKNKSRKRNLDAYSTAAHSVKPDKTVPRHRLGESVEGAPRQKRRRTDDDEADASEDDSAPQRKLPRQNGRGIADEDDDGVEQGSDSEGNEWTLGGLKDDDEDSELDSDEAFGESDEERFEGFAFRGSSSVGRKKVVRRSKSLASDAADGGIDLDEGSASSDGEDEDDDFGDEGVDLATMLDDDPTAEDAEDVEEDGDESDGASEEDEEDAPSEIDDEGEADGANDEERYARFRDRIEALDPTNKDDAKPLQPAESGIITMEDLLADIDVTQRKQILATTKPKRKSQRAERLTAPLPKRQQDRLHREAASEQAKEQLDRWRDTVIHNRRAEFLTFPLVDPSKQQNVGKDKFIDGKPQGELEESIRRIMEESGMVARVDEKNHDEEDELMRAEELATNDLPVEEVMRRRAELRRARELMFRQEVKAKRIAKIKSKAYRRVHRKERERLAEKERLLLHPDGGVDDEERDTNDRRRAQERMSTKHRDSKFAKSVKATNRTVWDEGARGGVMEEARRREELKRRIAGREEDGEGSDVSSVSGEDEENDEMEKQLQRLQEGRQGIGQRGVGGMKFMRAAEERRRKANEEDVERLRKEMAVEDGDEEESDGKVGEEGLGRAIFGPKAKISPAERQKEKSREMEEGNMSDDEEKVEIAVGADMVGASRDGAAKPLKGILRKGGQSSDKREPQRARSVWLKDPAPADEAQDEPFVSAWLTDPAAKKSKRRSRTTDDGEAMIELLPANGVAALGPPPQKTAKKASKEQKSVPTGEKDGEVRTDGTAAGNTSGWQTIEQTGDDSDGEEGGDANPALTADEQKALYHRQAFAGDDVHLAFEREKAELVADEDEKEISTHLPGWGSWTGIGLSKAVKKANKRQLHNPLFKTKLPGGVRPEDRKDAKLPNAIVSEKTDRKGKKYFAPVLPHGFEQGEQYERSLRVPLGPEWTTKEVFQRGTRPRVVVKRGVVVGPMEKPMV